MTIALGVLASDGIVVAADRQETVQGYWKGQQGKIRWSSHGGRLTGDDPVRSGGCIVTGAGDSALVDALSQRLLDEFINNREVEKQAEWQARFEAVIHEFITRNIVSYAAGVQDPNESPLRMIIAYQRNHHYGLWASHRSALAHDQYVLVGVGDRTAKTVLQRTGKPHYLTAREAVAVAAYAVYEAKQSTDGCGDFTDVCVLQDNRVIPVPQPLMRALEEQFQEYLEVIQPLLLQHTIAGTGEPMPTDRLSQVREAITAIVGHIDLALA